MDSKRTCSDFWKNRKNMQSLISQGLAGQINPIFIGYLNCSPFPKIDKYRKRLVDFTLWKISINQKQNNRWCEISSQRETYTDMNKAFLNSACRKTYIWYAVTMRMQIILKAWVWQILQFFWKKCHPILTISFFYDIMVYRNVSTEVNCY